MSVYIHSQPRGGEALSDLPPMGMGQSKEATVKKKHFFKYSGLSIVVVKSFGLAVTLMLKVIERHDELT